MRRSIPVPTTSYDECTSNGMKEDRININHTGKGKPEHREAVPTRNRNRCRGRLRCEVRNGGYLNPARVMRAGADVDIKSHMKISDHAKDEIKGGFTASLGEVGAAGLSANAYKEHTAGNSAERGKVVKGNIDWLLIEYGGSHKKSQVDGTIVVKLREKHSESEAAIEKVLPSVTLEEDPKVSCFSCYNIFLGDDTTKLVISGAIYKLRGRLTWEDEYLLEKPHHSVDVETCSVRSLTYDQIQSLTELQWMKMSTEQLEDLSEDQVNAIRPRGPLLYGVYCHYARGELELSSSCPFKQLLCRQRLSGPSYQPPFFPDIPEPGEEEQAYATRIGSKLIRKSDFDDVERLPGEEEQAYATRVGQSLVWKAKFDDVERLPGEEEQAYATRVGQWLVRKAKFDLGGRHPDFAFRHGEVVLVDRTSGKRTYGVIVSNASGKHVLDWSNSDLVEFVKGMPFSYGISGITLPSALNGPTAVLATKENLQEYGLSSVDASHLFSALERSGMKEPQYLRLHKESISPLSSALEYTSYGEPTFGPPEKPNVTKESPCWRCTIL